jgi:hypothetical protein
MLEKAPKAATFKSTSAFGKETPAVVGSTTIMSLVLEEGAALVSEIQFIGSVGRGDDKRNAIGRGVVRIADLDGKTSGIGDICRNYRRGALRNGVAGGGARRAGD